jgi:hypothetical protein
MASLCIGRLHHHDNPQNNRCVFCFYTGISGVAVRTGLRQSMPSISMDCARVSATFPLSVFGQTNRPRSNRL